MIDIGKVNDLIVSRETSSGFYLRDPETGDEVFMPPSMAPIKMKMEQEIKAFVYVDTKDMLIATDQIPYAEVGEFALLRVVSTEDFGAFLDWGIEKDLLVPGNEQKIKIRDYEEHLVRICLEEETDRLFGTTKLGKFIESSEFDFSEGDKVELVPVQETDLGYKVIIRKKYIGMIYHNEIYSRVQIGKTYDGFVKKMRADGLVDLALQVQGIKNLVDGKDIVLNMLAEEGGKSNLHDKSPPELIRSRLGMSKKTFKSSIGMLFKERKILINKDGIELAKEL